ncbi:hypothetical protein [Nocardioides sp. GXQ0305]|uniref:hypothetical protein n=1 Tax=Nocardioides sp. GXQ0305 TaxID=3423912 RepID=UPI003D7CA66C
MDDRTEVARLRERVAELEGQLAAREEGPSEAVSGSAWRAAVSGLCIILGCVLAPVSVASVWVNDILADTDTYVETVAPIAEQPAVQSALADKVTTVVLDNLDLQQVTSEALTSLSKLEDMPPRVAATLPALAVPISNGIENFTREQVNRALASPRFAVVWAQVNRVAHQQVVRLLKGEQGGAVTAQGDTITLNLGPVVEEVSQQMVDAGFTLAGNIPTVDVEFTLVQSDAVTRAQSAYRLLDALGTWLPFVSLGLIAAGVLLARDRWRALMRGALGVTVGMVVLGIALALARSAYVTTTPADILTAEAAGGVFDTLVRFLRTTLRAVAVLGLVVAVAAFLSGRSPQAVRARAGLERGFGGMRRRGEQATGWEVGRFGTWLGAHRRLLQVVVVGLGALVLLLWSSPTAWVVLWTTLAVVLALAVLQLLAAPAGTPRAADDADTARG